MTDTQN